MRLRTRIIMEQESVLSAKEKERVALLALVEDQRKKIEQLESAERQLSESLKAETAKVTEKEAMLSNNTNCELNTGVSYSLPVYMHFHTIMAYPVPSALCCYSVNDSVIFIQYIKLILRRNFVHGCIQL